MAVQGLPLLAVDSDHRGPSVLPDRPQAHPGGREEAVGRELRRVVTSDRYVGYHWLDVLQQQLCWAHLVRQLPRSPSVRARPASSALDCSRSRPSVHRPSRARGRAHRRRQSRAPALLTLREQLQPVRKTFQELLCRRPQPPPQTARFCAWLLEEQAALWTFCEVPGITPTTRLVTSDARPLILRRISDGTQSSAQPLIELSSLSSRPTPPTPLHIQYLHTHPHQPPLPHPHPLPYHTSYPTYKLPTDTFINGQLAPGIDVTMTQCAAQ